MPLHRTSDLFTNLRANEVTVSVVCTVFICYTFPSRVILLSGTSQDLDLNVYHVCNYTERPQGPVL